MPHDAKGDSRDRFFFPTLAHILDSYFPANIYIIYYSLLYTNLKYGFRRPGIGDRIFITVTLLMLQAFEKIRYDPKFTVEGCHYELARDDRRHQQLAVFVRDHFMPDEPIHKSIGTPWNEEMEGFFIAEVYVF